MSKEWKEQRRIKQKRDRSKYKKTDHKKWEARQRSESAQKLDADTLVTGRVLAIYSEEILVEQRQEIYTCTLRGLLKKERSKQANLIAVGDFVLFDRDELQIAHVNTRTSILSRMKGTKEQLLAANIDQVLITTSVVKPPLKPALVDRYIIAARKGNMEPIIVINKIDLLEKGSAAERAYRHTVKLYRALGFTVIPVSVITGRGLPTLKKAMRSKASVFSGQSGVGKSSLINVVADKALPIGEIIEKTLKGSHTTSRAHLIPLPFGGFCIDTPGIRHFGVWDLSRQDLTHYFPEIAEAAHHCKFRSCTHTHEPNCAVQEAVEEGVVDIIRFESYLKLLTELS